MSAATVARLAGRGAPANVNGGSGAEGRGGGGTDGPALAGRPEGRPEGEVKLGRLPVRRSGDLPVSPGRRAAT